MDQKRGPVSQAKSGTGTIRKQRSAGHLSHTSPSEIAAGDLKRFMNCQEGRDALVLLTKNNSWIEFGSKMVSGEEVTYCLTGQGLRCYGTKSGLPSRPTGRAAPPPGNPTTPEEVAAIYMDPTTSHVPGSSLSIGVFIKQALKRVQLGHLK